MKSSSSSSVSVYDVGMKVLREIEGCHFPGVIEEVDRTLRVCKIKYSDDGNVESMVHFDELTLDVGENSHINITDSRGISESSGGILMKPLAGLVDDDSEIRKDHKPNVIIHTDSNSDEAILINGDISHLAVGGGLKALRYLKS